MKMIIPLFILIFILNCNEAGAPIRNKRAACKATIIGTETCSLLIMGGYALADSSDEDKMSFDAMLITCVLDSLEERECNKESINLPEFFP